MCSGCDLAYCGELIQSVGDFCSVSDLTGSVRDLNRAPDVLREWRAPGG